jgi:hypothetical protein
MASPPTRLDEELYRSAAAEGKRMSRSAAQQIAHWARIGREVEARPSVTPADIAAVLDGRGDYDNLDVNEQAVVRAEWNERVAARLRELDYATEFAAAERSYSEVDGRGNAVRRTPAKRRSAAKH